MLKAIFLDLDETLCDTTGANRKALAIMCDTALAMFPDIDVEQFGEKYLAGIYRQLDERYSKLLLPVSDEGVFRLALIRLILNDLGVQDTHLEDTQLQQLQDSFDDARWQCFSFFPGIKEWLADLRQQYCLVVITNGPEFSQLAKVNAVNLGEHVDHIIIGGQEREQKPAKSIFEKAMRLAACNRDEVIHVGDSLSADIQGAVNAGIDSVWISHGNDLEPAVAAQPTHIIEHPTQLQSLFKALTQ